MTHHIRVISELNLPCRFPSPSAGHRNAGQMRGGELFPFLQDPPLQRLYPHLCSGSFSPEALLLCPLPALVSQPPIPLCTLPLAPLQSPSAGNPGGELLLQAPLSFSPRSYQTKLKGLNHRGIWKWWKRAGWHWMSVVGICPLCCKRSGMWSSMLAMGDKVQLAALHPQASA